MTRNGEKSVTQLMLCRENSLGLKAELVRSVLGTLIKLHLEIGVFYYVDAVTTKITTLALTLVYLVVENLTLGCIINM